MINDGLDTFCCFVAGSMSEFTKRLFLHICFFLYTTAFHSPHHVTHKLEFMMRIIFCFVLCNTSLAKLNNIQHNSARNDSQFLLFFFIACLYATFENKFTTANYLTITRSITRLHSFALSSCALHYDHTRIECVT